MGCFPAGKDLLTEAAISGFEEAKISVCDFWGGKAKVAKHVSYQKFCFFECLEGMRFTSHLC